MNHASPTSGQALRAIDQVCDRFEAAWQAGTRPRIEDYVSGRPKAEQAALLQELLAVELWHRRHRQERPTPEEYQQRFADYAVLIHGVFLERPPAAPPVEPANGSPPALATGPELAGAREADAPGRLGRYRIEAKLGSGTFGVVYKGYDEELRRDVAIKVPHRHRISSPQDIDAYLTEARILASLDHPGIVPVHDVGRTEDGLCYLVSKFVEGSDLKRRLQHARPSWAESGALICRVAEALHHAHRRGLVHRDIKPANILLDVGGQPLVADFGLALREEDFGKGPTFIGTPAYMSPEQARGEGHRVDARTDVYSLGVVLFELLTGQRPFRGTSVTEVLDQVKTLEPRPPRQLDETIPKELDRICLKALSKRATDRYSTALDLAEDLQHWLAERTDKETRRQGDKEKGAGDASRGGLDVTPETEPGKALVSLSPCLPVSLSAPSDNQPVKIVPKGLRSFDATDADFFLELLPGPRNRDGLPDSLRFWKTRLEATDPDQTFRVGLLYGPSGCGKSSLVKAGLLPRLAEYVLPVYVEATPDETEARLLHGLRKRCPQLPEGLSLVEALTTLRRGRGLAPGQKVVLVLDQLEQWLHAQQAKHNSELVEALRQCDGQHVQCLLLVRDDFWMATTRFMRDLEIRLVEGANSTAVDLFEFRHARKVLAAFGRAFGALPEGAAAPEQERFLDEAVTGLARDEKVIPVRLSLFAEMIKGKPWTPATLQEVGGTEGIGVSFLEGTFSAATAPPEHRMHQRAARAVLRALLPELGTDLRGLRRTAQDLLAASCYGQRPSDFNDLLSILDGELRLVTPTDPESIEDRGSKIEDREPKTDLLDPRSSKYYQLTHDYLIPALRQWLTRKQRETRRGRAELRLTERAALWHSKPQNRHLPAWWEWANISLWTRPRDWTPEQRRMMRAATRQQLLRAGVLVLLLAVVGWAFGEANAYLHAYYLVRELALADPPSVPHLIDELAPYRHWAKSRLLEMAQGPPASESLEDESKLKKRLYANLALLPVEPVEPERVDYLFGRLLRAEAHPDELLLVRDALAKHPRQHGQRIAQLWKLALDAEADPDRRFRAACALASFDHKDERWAQLSDVVARKLLQEDQYLFQGWRNLLLPLRDEIVKSLVRISRDPDRPESERSLAAYLFVRFGPLTTTPWAECVELVLDADGRQYDELLHHFMWSLKEDAARLMKEELDKKLQPDLPEKDQEVQLRRKAHAAVVLLQLDQAEERTRPQELLHADRLWPLIRQGSDPRLHRYLVHRLARVGVNPETLIGQYELEKDVVARRVLLLSLGEFAPHPLPAAKRQPLVAQLLHTYRTDPDPDLHAAVDWLLRQRWGQGAALEQIDQERAGQPAAERK